MQLPRRSFLLLTPAVALLASCTTLTSPTSTADIEPERLTTDQIIAKINAVRVSNGAPPWAYNARLAAAAKSQADLMASRDLLSHDLGVTLRERVAREGYDGAVGENVAGGQRSLDQAIAGWLASPGHRSTLLSTKFIEFGLAVSKGERNRDGYGIYWAMIAGGTVEAWLEG